MYSEFRLSCEYQRERKKRGKASRKDLAQKAVAQAAAAAVDPGSPASVPVKKASSGKLERKTEVDSTTGIEKEESVIWSDNCSEIDERLGSRTSDSLSNVAGQSSRLPGRQGVMERAHLEGRTAFVANTYANIHHPYGPEVMEAQIMNPAAHHDHSPKRGGTMAFPDVDCSLQTEAPTSYTSNLTTFPMATSPLNTYPIAGDGPSPGWIDMLSPPHQHRAHRRNPSCHTSQLRYPVLEPLRPHLGTIIPLSLACDLIDLYFSSSSSAQMHPMSPYVLGYVFRKRSFLHPSRPRMCQPALLASMLWVAAQTSDASLLTSVPSARGLICHKLLELTVSLLKPLIHTLPGGEPPVSSPTAIDGVALGGLGVALPGSIGMEALSSETGPFGATGTVDDVVTYIHLATVVSASEYKGASLRWWNAAWSLARELRLGREHPQTVSAPETGSLRSGEQTGVPGTITEEEREERRRVWWIVYIVDRHLALCYNRPLFLLDVECGGLLRPMDDTAFQNGDFQHAAPPTDPTALDTGSPTSQFHIRTRGPSFECSGHSIFGYFIPLMTILGEIVGLNHARNHPRFGVGFRSAREWDRQAVEIERHLELYEQSLESFARCNLGTDKQEVPDDHQDDRQTNIYGPADVNTSPVRSVRSVLPSTSRMTELEIQTRIVLAYGTHVMHVLHILLTGKWDPINLLDDNDLWISSQEFITAAGHAVCAAEAISRILEYDPGLESMPFFFGIYLLQGSFLLLLIADRLQSEASASVVKACETITRAHEACVVTLNTEYQVSLSPPLDGSQA